MKISYLLASIGVMALVTYLVRMLPLTLIRGKISGRFWQSFLYYVPFAVLAAMVIPDIFTATGSIWSAVAALVVAVALSVWERSLMTVAVCSCLAVFVVEWLV